MAIATKNAGNQSHNPSLFPISQTTYGIRVIYLTQLYILKFSHIFSRVVRYAAGINPKRPPRKKEIIILNKQITM